MNDKLVHVIVIILLALVALLVYYETSKLSWVADDRPLFYGNTDFLEDWGNLKSTFVSPLPVKTYEPLPYYRPVVSLTFFVCHHFGKSIQSNHLFNLGVHTLNTLLLYLLIFLLFKNIPLSILTGLFFAAHPIHVSSVVWISGRTDLIAATFFLLTVILFLKAKNHDEMLPRRLLFTGAAVSYILCLFSKETTLVLPVFLLVWDFLFRKEPIRKRIIPYLSLVIISILYLAWRTMVIGNLGTGEPYTSSGLFHRFLTVFPIYFYYFKKLVLPLEFNFSPRVLTPTSILSLSFLGSLIAVAVLLGMGISLRRRSKEICLGILWILVTLLPVLNLVPLYAPVKEWWAYIPSVGFCLILGKLTLEGLKWRKKILEISLPRRGQDVETLEGEKGMKGEKILGIRIPALPDKIVIRANHLLASFFAFLLIFYAFSIKSQAEVFRKDIFFWRAAVKRAPYDVVVRNTYGSLLYARGIQWLAERQFKKAIQEKPDFAEAHNSLGMLYQARGQNDSALVEIREALRLDSDYAEAYANLGFVYADKKEFLLAIDSFKEALRLDPQHYAAHRNLGMVYSYIGSFSLAIEHLEKALDLAKNPRDIKQIEEIIEIFKAKKQ